jgi:signal transduction histidine kinase
MQLSTKAAKRIFLLTAILLLGLSAVLYRQIDSLLKSQDQLNHTNLLKLKLEQLLGSLIDTETAQRGFLLTRDSAFLTPYRGAYARSNRLLTEINQLAGPDEQPKFNALQTFVAVRFGTFTHLFSVFDDPSLTPELRKMLLRRTKATMDSIRFYVQDIEAKADEMHRNREAENRKYTFLAPFYAVLLMALAIVILVFSYEKIVTHLKRTRQLLFRLKKLNNKLKHKNHQLELSNKELDSFTYIASHDLKEPLRKILTYTSMIEQKGEDVSFRDNAVYFEKIKHSAERMQNLLDDLLYYSHTSNTERTFEDVDLNKVVTEVVRNLDEEIAETGAKITYANLPVIKGMPFQIKQLFENLISNSLKYKKKETAPVINIDSTLVGENEIGRQHHKVSSHYVKLLFRDNGLGFEQSYAERIFRLFQRLHAQNGYKGTGIGLTICKKVVDNHNGIIKAHSEVNEGTTFEIYFPA